MKELLAQEKALVEQLSAVRAAIEEKKLAEVEVNFGVRVGSIVTRRGVEHLVTEIRPWGNGGKPWVSGHPKKKDGSFGTAVRSLYEYWELAREIEKEG